MSDSLFKKGSRLRAFFMPGVWEFKKNKKMARTGKKLSRNFKAPVTTGL